MTNKIIYIFLTIFILTSCRTDTNTADTSEIPSDNSPTGFDKAKGKWVIGSIISRSPDSEGQGFCNSCPVITFDNNSIAIIDFPGGPDDSLTWAILGDTMTLKNLTSNPDTAYIPDDKYLMLFSKKDKYTELRLNSKDSGLVYVLGQAK